MKKLGKCPKCDSREVYSNEGASNQGERSYLFISSFKRARISIYACLNCGFTEEYIDNKSLANHGKMDKIRSKWTKVL